MFRIINTIRLASNSQQFGLAARNILNRPISRFKPNGASNLVNNATHGVPIRVNLTCCIVQHVGVTVKFHTSPCRRALPPLLLLFIKPLGKVTAILFGKTVKRWWFKLPPEQRQAIILSVRKNKRKIYMTLTLIPTGFFLYYITHLEVDPITGRRKFIAYKEEQVMQLAQLELDAQIEIHKGNFLLPSHPAFKRVASVSNRLLKSNSDLPQVQNRKWLVTVVDEPQVMNAFVLPTGHIFMFTGMLNECVNDDQLCVILAHEVAHVLLNHSGEQLSHLNFVDWVLMVPIALIWAILPDLGAMFTHWLSNYLLGLMFHLPFSRSLESEADQVGLQLTAKACYDVREASAFWAKMSVHEGDQIEWLSTHPNSETRYAKLDELMPKAIKLREDSKCPRLPIVDPRSFNPKKHNPGIKGG